MKIRNGFVSNSSSSSFILFKEYLTNEQIDKIGNYDNYIYSPEYFEEMREFFKETKSDEEIDAIINQYIKDLQNSIQDGYSWSVQETNNLFDIHTDLDDFDFEQFLEIIGVDVDKMGLRTYKDHCQILGLNDAKTDIKNYVEDPYYFENYKEEYYLTSKEYRDKIYKDQLDFLKGIINKNPDIKHTINMPEEPKEKKIWINRDVGKVLDEVYQKVIELARNNKVYYPYKTSTNEYPDEKSKEYGEVLEVINKIKNNWRILKEDDSQRVMAAIEGEGYFNKNV